MQIRSAHDSDIKAIARVHIDSWKTTYKGIVPDDFLANLSYERREQAWREILANAQGQVMYVAEDNDGKVVGFANAGPARDEPNYQSELYALYLLESHQNRGMGRRLVRNIAEDLLKRGYESMLVWVLSANPARGFYERLGGQYLREKEITIGNANLVEVAYGWPDIRLLVE